MSHIVEARTELVFRVTDPTGRRTPEQLLAEAYTLIRPAVEVVASQHRPYRRYRPDGDEEELLVTDFYFNWSKQECRSYYVQKERQTYPLGMGLFVEGLELGMGIFIHPRSGELRFVGDPYGAQPLFDQLKNQIVQVYTAMQFQAVLAEIGYQTSVESGEQGRLILRGVSYA